jgi:vibriolysin
LCISPLFAAGNRAPSGTVQTFEFGTLGTLDVPRTSPEAATTNAGAATDPWGGAAETFARGYAAGRGAAGTESFATRRVIRDQLGRVHVRLDQRIAGLPVVGAELIVHADANSGNVIGVNGRFAPDSNLPRLAGMQADAAIEQTMREYGLVAGFRLEAPRLTYVVAQRDDSVHLAWTNLVRYRDEQGEQVDRIYADALTGAAVARHPQIHRARYREAYTADNGYILPGRLLFSEGSWAIDEEAWYAYTYAGITYNYYSATHGRDSLDDAGRTIMTTAHYGVDVNNAFWLLGLLVFGDGDGITYGPLSRSLDAVAHEYTHGVTAYAAGLVYSDESGALNESMSDCFAAAVEAYSDGSVNTDVWKIADTVYTPATAGDALRYMYDPAVDGSSRDYYPARYTGSSDNGGLHWNSGIQNLAFYLLVEGGYHPRRRTTTVVTAIGMPAAEKIFYHALDKYAGTDTNFRLMREYTLQAAADLYGTGSKEQTAVRDAWTAVGNSWALSSKTFTRAGGSWTSDSYTTTTSIYHTGHLLGAETNFNLHLQKRNGFLWQTVASGTSLSANEIVQYAGLPGEYRWRVVAVDGTGKFNLYTNPN